MTQSNTFLIRNTFIIRNIFHAADRTIVAVVFMLSNGSKIAGILTSDKEGTSPSSQLYFDQREGLSFPIFNSFLV
jgi:hypothetical protein